MSQIYNSWDTRKIYTCKAVDLSLKCRIFILKCQHRDQLQLKADIAFAAPYG